MSKISADFALTLARVWHRFEPAGQDMQGLATMLAPMDDAGERLSADVEFDMEPADFTASLAAMAKHSDAS